MLKSGSWLMPNSHLMTSCCVHYSITVGSALLAACIGMTPLKIPLSVHLHKGAYSSMAQAITYNLYCICSMVVIFEWLYLCTKSSLELCVTLCNCMPMVPGIHDYDDTVPCMSKKHVFKKQTNSWSKD